MRHCIFTNVFIPALHLIDDLAYKECFLRNLKTLLHCHIAFSVTLGQPNTIVISDLLCMICFFPLWKLLGLSLC